MSTGCPAGVGRPGRVIKVAASTAAEANAAVQILSVPETLSLR
jgi:hypothetical protein